jgi:putative PIG3 family NAD(P)H quinone oxidoreductase
MRAAVITEPGGPGVLVVREIEDPRPGPEDALVAVRASALNRADLLQRLGRYAVPYGVASDIPGLEMAGEVIEVGERVARWKPGDRVMALLNGGGYASRVIAHERMLMPVPTGLDFEQAAAIPEVFLTAYDALFRHCELAPGERVLIHAAGSGVGTAGIQIASVAGCPVFGTAGSDDKLASAAELGLDVGINYRTQDFAEVVKERTAGRGVDVILDVIGAPYWDRNIASLAELGRMVLVGTMGGGKLETDISRLMGKRLRVSGTVLRARSLEEKAQLTQEFAKRWLPLFSTGRLRPVIDRVFALDEVAAAHAYMESNANFGKIVLRIEG